MNISIGDTSMVFPSLPSEVGLGSSVKESSQQHKISNIETEESSAAVLDFPKSDVVGQDKTTVQLSEEAQSGPQAGVKDVYQDPRVEAREKQKASNEAKEQQVDDLKVIELSKRDREVRAHEQAHMAAGGMYAGGATYQYERGPNGVSYAVGGEVSISTGEGATPAESLRKAQVIRSAALAPANPSSQDRRVAAMATQMETQARSDIAQLKKEETVATKEGASVETKISETDEKPSEEVPNGLSEAGSSLDNSRIHNIDSLFSPAGDRAPGILLSDHA